MFHILNYLHWIVVASFQVGPSSTSKAISVSLTFRNAFLCSSLAFLPSCIPHPSQPSQPDLSCSSLRPTQAHYILPCLPLLLPYLFPKRSSLNSQGTNCKAFSARRTLVTSLSINFAAQKIFLTVTLQTVSLLGLQKRKGTHDQTEAYLHRIYFLDGCLRKF